MYVNKMFLKTSTSAERLYKLINERLKPNANKEKIDTRIWDLFGEELTIMFTDLSGFSRNVEQFGIIHFLQTIFESERILMPIIEEYDGILLKSEGDSLLVVFKNVEKALQCAISMQNATQKYNIAQLEEEKILLCIGLGFGKVLKIGDSDVFGAEVNAASKLGEDIAKAYEILITHAVYEKVKNNKNLKFKKINEKPYCTKAAYKVIY